MHGVEPDQEPLGEGRPFGVKHKTDTAFRTHPVTAHAAMLDGSVRLFYADLKPQVLSALVTINGGEKSVYPED